MIKSPVNYMGGKYKILNKIIPLFPERIDTFIDLFGGAFNVGININANTIYYNELNKPLYELIKEIGNFKINDIKNIMQEHTLNSYDKESYLKFRQFYNNNKTPLYLYILMCHSFSNIMRFNRKGNFNAPFGERTFNKTIENNLLHFQNKIIEKNIKYSNVDFRNFPIIDGFYYLDPPYRISTATYNENNGWTIEDDLALMNYCDKLNSKNIKFAMSNVFTHKGIDNLELINWSTKYNIHYINKDYNSCNYQRKNKDKPTIEVIITNY